MVDIIAPYGLLPIFSRWYNYVQMNRVWSCKVSMGVMQEQEFLISYPCKTQDSHEKWSLKSCKKYHCKTMQDLVPTKSNRNKGGGYGGVEPAFWVLTTSYRTKLLFYLVMTVSTYVNMVLHFLQDQGCMTRPRSRKKSQVLVSQGLAARTNSTIIPTHPYVKVVFSPQCLHRDSHLQQRR
jgi:hypothetical protein